MIICLFHEYDLNKTILGCCICLFIVFCTEALGGLRTTCGAQSSSPTMWVLGIEFWSLGLVTSALAHGSISRTYDSIS